jgi:hypothetical protein
MFVLVQVSSMKISLPASSLGWFSRYSARALAPPGRSCPAARSDFFLSDRPSSFNVCQISPTLAATWCVANATSAIPRSWYRHVRQHTRGSLCRPAPASAACGRAERARPSHPSCDARQRLRHIRNAHPQQLGYLTNTLTIVRRAACVQERICGCRPDDLHGHTGWAGSILLGGR